MARFVRCVTYPAAVAVIATLAVPAFGQGFDIRNWFNWGAKESTGSVPASQTTPAPQLTPAPVPAPTPAQTPSGPLPWSGESGSSGHPLMTAEAIRKSACSFGWDWGISTTTSGIWRPVRLVSWSGARFGEVRVVAEPDGDGGSVSVDSSPGRTRFEVRLPSPV